MQTYLKTKPVWMQLLMFLGIAFGLFIIASTVTIALLPQLTGVTLAQIQDSKTWNASNPGFITFLRAMILVQFLFLFTIPSLIFSYLSDRQPLNYLGLKSAGTGTYWALGILLILVAYPFVEYLGLVNQKIPVGDSTAQWMKSMEEEATRQIKFMLQRHTPAELIKNLIFISLFAGIGEELFFRGILQRMAIRVFRNPWMGIIITAAIFSGIHFQFYGFLPRLFLGMLLGAIYWYSGSLWIAIIAHFLYDAAVIVLLYVKPQLIDNASSTVLPGQQWQITIAAFISGAITVLILTQMQRRSVASFEAVYSDDFPKDKNDLSF